MRSLFFLLLFVLLLAPRSIQAEELPPLEGLIEPNELVQYSSQVPGILEQVLVERGTWVKKRQTIATLKSGVQRAALKLAKARVDFGKRKLLRNEQLIKKQLISINDKDEIETEVRFSELEVSQAEEQLALRTIRSTIAGVVVQRTGSPGEYVGEDPFLTIASIDPLSVEVVVPSGYYGAIKKGAEATVEIEGPLAGQYKARVIIVDQIIDAASSTFGVRLELPNPKKKLPAGLKCIVTF
ncbi:efflux RND transporter periplasmic adaptor subunit [Desulforhopalus vacuolatus]|uniref:efflux RND transporter periplasmic adaptor subunit n=1 Tax=Desulforhopalus vacuolatus TaxID=40414 RepID=UPI0019626FE8|nr:efflux RND transporter periplasmic adaptor subunit [Desulforhopalus vacuolatus]MBM9518790.1 efflux RND transporter periplasmic adaptor subunit [Desulforhopalus vacuolatus]